MQITVNRIARLHLGIQAFVLRSAKSRAGDDMRGVSDGHTDPAVDTAIEDEMTDRQVPDDFPRNQDLGSVTGVQPKLLVREVDGRYQSGPTDEELWVRYDACEDLASQLSAYVSRKIASSGLSPDVALTRAEKGVRLKVDAGEWGFSQREMAWVIKRTRQLLFEAADKSPNKPTH
ncbi:hypothetical protein [Paraburkholderia phenoliruptrix]|uniref:hypothetical protein n=1 Tax=Paraburkholderia phenoliruptrix TaxID=252970 RepID=UPI002869B972|nr:hypothetical protein [Paraburkholderia phenoliruptrix]WMY07292.1 hypothetical protein P3F88_13535 [Paraburkholderia phenoliruptrix]